MTPAELIVALRSAGHGYRGPYRIRKAMVVSLIGECGLTLRKILDLKPADVPWSRMSPEGRDATERWIAMRASRQTPEDAPWLAHGDKASPVESSLLTITRDSLLSVGEDPSLFLLRRHSRPVLKRTSSRRLSTMRGSG